MRTNELMLRDWVNTRYGIGKVVHIGIIYIIVSVDGKDRICKDEEIEPILLTSEIIEKNGWCSRMNGTGEFYLKKPLVDAAIVTKIITGFQMNHGPFSGLSIHYVHELQHVLRLCGIDKEIII